MPAGTTARVPIVEHEPIRKVARDSADAATGAESERLAQLTLIEAMVRSGAPEHEIVAALESRRAPAAAAG